jgi:hypothetical protein
MWRHRFIVGKWVWELPGGYIDDGQDGAAAAVAVRAARLATDPATAEPVVKFRTTRRPGTRADRLKS